MGWIPASNDVFIVQATCTIGYLCVTVLFVLPPVVVCIPSGVCLVALGEYIDLPR